MKSLILAAALAVVPLVAHTQQRCAPVEQVYQFLAEQHGESRTVAGLDGGGILMEVWTNPETGSWTLLATRPSGLSCLAADGTDFAQGAALENISGDPA